MIHLVTSDNRARYADAMDQYFKLRHDIYVVERQWRGLTSSEGREIDDYDDDDSSYFLSIEDGRVTGASRIRPSTKPHMLETVCPQLADVRGIPRGDGVFEWTRIFVVKNRRDGRYGGVLLGELFAAAIEYGVEEGIDEYSIALEAWWLPRLQALSWRLRPLGLPALINSDWWMAATLPLDLQTLHATRGFYELKGPSFVREGLPSRPMSRIA